VRCDGEEDAGSHVLMISFWDLDYLFFSKNISIIWLMIDMEKINFLEGWLNLSCQIKK
jgi:hypothetical protein